MGSGKGQNKRVSVANSTVDKIIDNPMFLGSAKKKGILGKNNVDELVKEFNKDMKSNGALLIEEMKLMGDKDWKLNNDQLMFLSGLSNDNYWIYHELMLDMNGSIADRLERSVSYRMGRLNVSDNRATRLINLSQMIRDANKHRIDTNKQRLLDDELRAKKNNEGTEVIEASKEEIDTAAKEEAGKIKDQNLHF